MKGLHPDWFGRTATLFLGMGVASDWGQVSTFLTILGAIMIFFPGPFRRE